jgi:hypothetical protein
MLLNVAGRDHEKDLTHRQVRICDCRAIRIHGLVVATATVVRGLSSVQLSVSASGHQSAAAPTHGARHGEAAARRAPRTCF